MQGFMMMLLTYSASLSVVILIYIAITPLLSKRYSAKGLYYTWLVMIVGLIIPFRPQLNAIIIKDKVPVEAVLTKPLSDISTWFVNTAAPIHNSPTIQAMPDIQWWQLIAVLWLTGAIFSLAYNGFKHFRFIKMATRWSEQIIDEQKLAIMKSIQADFGISKLIKIFLCPCIGSPMMIGLLNPQILLPSINYSEDELHFILCHELVHLKRKDLWYKCLMLVATAIHWFNPVVYLMTKAVNVQCELSCDAEVVQNANDNMRQQYCETIIGVVKNKSKLITALSTNFHGGKYGMKKRISSIMDTKKKKISLAVAVIFIILVMVVGVGMASTALNPDTDSKMPTSNSDINVSIRLADNGGSAEYLGTSVSNVDARPGLVFFIDGEDIAQIELKCVNEYLYAVDLTKTQSEKYWNSEYYQTYDQELKVSTFYPERLYDKSMLFTFGESFSDYADIEYRWTAWNLYEWAAKDDFSHFMGYGISPKIEIPDDITEEQKLKMASGDDGSGFTGIGHIQLDGYPENMTEDSITITVTDRKGNSTTKEINIKISNNEYNQTVVTAKVEN